MDKSKKIMFIVLGVLVFVLFAINGLSYAKYASKTAWNYYLKTKGFYMESTVLGITNINNVNNMWDGGKVYFDINNYSNKMLVSDSDINYTVVCEIINDTRKSRCKINGGTEIYNGVLSKYEGCINNTYEPVDPSKYTRSNCEMHGYEWVNSPATSNLYFEVENNNFDITDATVKITVTSTYPYEKTLIGTFKIHKVASKDEEVYMTHNSYANHEEVVITNPSSGRENVSLSFDSDIVTVDGTYENYELSNAGTINKIYFNMFANSSVKLIFYKNDVTSEVTDDIFTLESVN